MNGLASNMILWIALVLLESIQAVILLGVILGKLSPSLQAVDQLLPEAYPLFRPEHELGLFIFFVFSMLAGTMGGVYALVKKKTQESLWPRWRLFFTVELIWTLLIVAALQKTIFFDYRAQLAQEALFVVLGLSLLSKLFFDYLCLAWQRVLEFFARINQKPRVDQYWLVGVLFFILLLIYIPHPGHALARMYVGDQFHHFDMSLMAPGWAAANGHHIDVDQISQYGVGLPKVVAFLAQCCGGFEYTPMLIMLMGAVLIYYLVFFLFCRWFLESTVIALMVVLWGIRTQMFHPGDYPFYFTYPSTTALRFWLDTLVFACVLAHTKYFKQRWLWCAGIISGISIWYMDSTGIFLSGAFIIYVLSTLLIPSLRLPSWGSSKGYVNAAVLMALPFVVAVTLLFLSTGAALLTGEFWRNLLETVDYFLSGIGTYPMTESFKYHNFGAGLIGFVIPLVYVASILVVGSLCYLGRLPVNHILIVVIACYGLGVNHYYIARSLLTCYYVTGLPLMIVLGYWVKRWLELFDGQLRKNLIGWFLVLSVYALFTNHSFMAYPNVFNVSANPMVDTRVAQPLPADGTSYFCHLFRNDPESLKLPVNSLGETDEHIVTEHNFANDKDLAAYYTKDFDFSEDAAMIQSLVPQGQGVALISSFEAKILIQANRPPFFYFFPLINSRPKHMRTLPLAALHTNTQRFNQRTIDQLEQNKTRYVFMEKVFLSDRIPSAYREKSDQLMTIVDYVLAHYETQKVGKYLVAMKHK